MQARVAVVRRAAALAGSLILLSWSEEAVAQVDSAGVHIVRVDAGSLVATPLLAGPPIVRIGEGAGAHALHLALHVHLAADSGVLIVNAGSREIRRFGSAGHVQWITGRAGQGPGEFGGAQLMAWRCLGDSLLVYDSSNRRFSLFDQNGKFARSQQRQRIENEPVLLPTRVQNMRPGCGLVAYGRERSGNAAFADSTKLYSVDPFSPSLSTVAIGQFYKAGLPSAPAQARVAPGRGSMAVATGATVSLAGAFRPVNLLTGADRLHVVDERVPEIRSYSYQGRLLQITRWDSPSAVAANAAMRRLPQSQRRTIALGAFVDDEGRLWVQDMPDPPASSRATWLVFGANGSLLRKAWVPASLSLKDVRGDRALVQLFDRTNNVELVQVYRLAPQR